MDFGSIIDAIRIPVGSADAVLTGVINSINVTLAGVGKVFNDVTGSLGGSL